jgi:alpha-galactosidase/6-phospho-beta-glucosidase family protein
MRKKIVLVGGGSFAWSPRLLRDMFLTEELENQEYVLYDIDHQAAEKIGEFARKLAGKLQVKPQVKVIENMKEAFTGADYIIITISTGGLAAMETDISLPEEYGIYHTVGDTAGPGGWARTIRNWNAFTELAEGIGEFAPKAMVLNYTNPMTTLTGLLCEMLDNPVVGLCHGLFENLSFLVSCLELEREEELSVRYAGLNHFFWITKITAGGQEHLPLLYQQVREKEITSLAGEKYTDPAGHSSGRKLASELFRITGFMPYLGDRHICEFLPGYITDITRMEQYGLRRTTIEERRERRTKMERKIETAIQAGIPDEFLRKSRETAADIITAHACGKPFIDVGNLPNRGQISNLPPELVVETAVVVDQTGFQPLTFGPLPSQILPFLEPYARVFLMTMEACRKQDWELALQALRADPVCGNLSGKELRKMGRKLLRENKSYIVDAENTREQVP